ncbi:DNA polymerase-4 [Austwickia chelonae]|uniref:DNA polymerase IV n=1 Tax=Austwickia chelonae NBRC 105200 TaxID=1184607 RepID=K6VQH6_9MICO|nr:DNA polymerase IV [Austwickia chelonae]GAB77615.1 DNA polymerase IV [Austwickia chelonae NBRC 105200]SEW14165.1 DNA polymerase-4 [Austwickia chelonae]
MSRRHFALPRRSGDQPPDDVGCSILHVDMDAFYASVSLLDRPELVGRPVVVGGGPRGVVLSATYEARSFGVTSAMPLSRARRLCPQAVLVAPDHAAYAQVSRSVMAIFGEITPVVEPLSTDEAFLDVSGALRRLGPPAAIGELVRARVLHDQGITCSVGVAANKFVAKLASSLAKPDGLLVVPEAEAAAFVQQLPVGALWGVGDRTEEILIRAGFHTVGDIARASPSALSACVGAIGERLYDFAWARDDRSVVPTRQEKSLGADETFAQDIDDRDELRRRLLHLSEKVAARARSHRVLARTVNLRVRFSDFRTVGRSRTLARPTDTGQEIFAVVGELFADLARDSGGSFRLLGVRLEGLLPAEGTPLQGTLGEPEHGWREADRAVDRVSARFGEGAVRPASLVGPDECDRIGSRRGGRGTEG